jgi:hypothetical protein
VTTLIILVVVGAIVTLLGAAIIVFREPYAAWWNVARQNTRRPRPGTFTARWSIFYGVIFFVAGLIILAINIARLVQAQS